MTYLINASEVWSLCIVHTNLPTNGKKKHSCTKLSMRNDKCENRLCTRAPPARQGSLEFGRKVFLVDCLL